MEAPPRRVVTGHLPNGKSAVLFDGPVPEGPVSRDRYVWITATNPADNRGTADAAQAPHRLEPPANSSVFRVVAFPPESALPPMSAQEKRAFFDELFGSMGASHCRVDTSRSPGMHKTSTVDYIVVLRGAVTMIMDEGEVTLKAGDLVVQRGTNHDWVVRGNEPCLIAAIMIGAHPV
jgi:mannose-6-phosphate isomerase-like protein (cupin superfamily)